MWQGCKSGPKVTLCILDPEKGGLDCVTHDKKEYFQAFDVSTNYVCTSPDDFRTLLEYCYRKGRPRK